MGYLRDWVQRHFSDPQVIGLATVLFHDGLGAEGWQGYEVSNFAASPPHRSRHNRKYWTRASYLGLGPAAHSFREPLRFWNHRDLGRYLADLDAAEAARLEHDHHGMYGIVEIGRELVGIPAVLRVAAVGVDGAEHPVGVAVNQQRQHHPRVVLRRAAAALIHPKSVHRHPLHRRQHEMRQVVLGHPLTQVHRQQHRLPGVRFDELFHANENTRLARLSPTDC